jgi:hypothetical protein
MVVAEGWRGKRYSSGVGCRVSSVRAALTDDGDPDKDPDKDFDNDPDKDFRTPQLAPCSLSYSTA